MIQNPPFDQIIPVLPVKEGEKSNRRAGIIRASEVVKGDFIAFNKETASQIGRWFKVRDVKTVRIQGRIMNIKLEGTSQVGLDAEINLSPEDRVRRLQ